MQIPWIRVAGSVAVLSAIVAPFRRSRALVDTLTAYWRLGIKVIAWDAADGYLQIP
jgi:hypothetical protein